MGRAGQGRAPSQAARQPSFKLEQERFKSLCVVASGTSMLGVHPAQLCSSARLPACRSPFALPALLVTAPLLFYGVLFACGMSLEDAREAGWVSKPQVRELDGGLQAGRQQGQLAEGADFVLNGKRQDAWRSICPWQQRLGCPALPHTPDWRMFACVQPGDGEWEFWKAWSLYNVPPLSNIYWSAMPGQVGGLPAGGCVHCNLCHSYWIQRGSRKVKDHLALPTSCPLNILHRPALVPHHPTPCFAL